MTDNQPIPPAPQSENNANNEAAYPNGNAVSEVNVPPPRKCHPQTCHKKRDGWDIAKLIAEFVGLVFLIVYTLYTAGIYCANQRAAQAAQDTLGEIQKQTKLARQQLIGTQAAIVSLNGNGNLSTTPMPITDANVILSIGLKNDGHVIANAISMRLKIQVLSLTNNNFIGPEWPCDFVIPTLAPGPAAYRLCHITGLSSEDLRLISELRRTIAIDGSYSYDNGFGETKTEQMCFRYSPETKTPKHGTEEAGVFSCEGFNVMRDRILRELAEK